MSSLKTTNILNPSSTTNNIVLAADGSTTISTLTATTIQGTIKSGTAVASTSGTSIDFTSIPSWAKRVTVMFSGVSTNGTSPVQMQIGDSGGIETSGYSGATQVVTTNSSFSAAFQIDPTGQGNASVIRDGILQLCLLNGTTNLWACSGVLGGNTASPYMIWLGGSKALSATLDRVRITTVNGTDTFDAGSINILYEG
jgi:hypothetical protein